MKQSNSNRRNKSMQDKINYENAIMRNKILNALQQKKKSHSLSKVERTNPRKVSLQEEMYQTNLKLGERLTNMRSDISHKYNFKEHEKMSDQYSMMIQKKSPKKKAYMKSLTSKRVRGITILPEIEDSLYS